MINRNADEYSLRAKITILVVALIPIFLIGFFIGNGDLGPAFRWGLQLTILWFLIFFVIFRPRSDKDDERRGES
jgi:hypothetical protein